MEDIENIGSKGTPPFNIPVQEVAGVISPSMPLVSYIVWISMQFHCLTIELQPMQRCQHPATAALRCGGVEGHLAPPAKLLHVGPEPLVPHLLLYINHMLRPFHPSFFCISTTNADLHYSYLTVVPVFQINQSAKPILSSGYYRQCLATTATETLQPRRPRRPRMWARRKLVRLSRPPR